MSQLLVFNTISIDGYFNDGSNDMTWAYSGNDDAEWNAFIEGNVKSDGILLFGRVTYDMMAAYWPTDDAIKQDPEVANGMNTAKKFVVSRKMEKAEWSNTQVINGDIVAAITKLKASSTQDIVILGSGSIVGQLASAGVIDQYLVIVKPIILGIGHTMFEGISKHIPLKLKSTRTFKNSNVLLDYRASTN